MFTSTINNFGAGEVSFNHYQNSNIVVLNAKISFNPNNEDFISASVLEITVPELSIPKSAITSCYIVARFGDGEDSYGTILKTWIKNNTTLCIEKLVIPEWNNASEYIIYILSIYVPKAQRRTMTAIDKSSGHTVTSLNPKSQNGYAFCYAEDNWYYVWIHINGYYYPPENNELDIFTIENFPTDISLELPFISGSFDADKPGSEIIIAKLENAQIKLQSSTKYWEGYNANFFSFVAVRNNT